MAEQGSGSSRSQTEPSMPAKQQPSKRSRISRWRMRVARVVVWIPLLFYWVWSVGAAWHYTLAPPWFRFLLASTALAIPFFVSIRTRRFFPVGKAIAAVICTMAILWLLMRPSNDRPWQAELAKTPRISIEDESVTIQNFMTLSGAATRSFNLDALKRIWLGVEKFPDFDGGAHNFLTFEFDDQQFVSISVEARREVGEDYGLLPALFRQFELIYLIGDEAQVFANRTDFAAPTYLFPLKSNAEQRRALLLDLLNRADELADAPEWYNILTNNCTNNLSWHASRIAPRPISSYDLRVVMTGHVDRVLYAMDMIDGEGSLQELERQFRMDERAKNICGENAADDSFSTRVRRDWLPASDASEQTLLP